MTGVVDGVLANDRFPKWFIEGMAQTTSGAYYDNNDWVANSLGINTSTSQADISKALSTNPLSGSSQISNYGTGYLACMYLGYLAGGNSVNAAGIKKGLGTILKDIKDGASLEDEVKKLTGYSSLSEFQNKFASDQQALQFIQDLTKVVGSGTGGVVGDLTKPDDILLNTTPTANVSLFALNITNDRVANKYPAGYTVFGGGSTTNKTNGGVPTSTAALKLVDGRGTSLHLGADADGTNKMTIYIDAMDSASLGVSDVDVMTSNQATISIVRVSLALAMVSAQRSEIGAYQNRLEHSIKNLDNVVENTTSAESEIRDTDMATEMVRYSNTNILAQAGQSMLAQANQSKDGVLELLKFAY
jgi:flagellin